jgi:hypothetical protein
MKARIAHEYSEFEKKHYYYCDNSNIWVWFGIGQKVPDDINLYPFIPWGKKVRGRTITAKDYHTLGLRCGVQLMKYFNKNESTR